MYNYKELITDDVIDYINDAINPHFKGDKCKLERLLNYDLSKRIITKRNMACPQHEYFLSAQNYVEHNFDILDQATNVFDIPDKIVIQILAKQDYDALDMLIRLYLLPECIHDVIYTCL